MLKLSCEYDKPCPKWHPPGKIRHMVNLDWPPFQPMMSSQVRVDIKKIKYDPNYPFFQTGEKHFNSPQKPSKIL